MTLKGKYAILAGMCFIDSQVWALGPAVRLYRTPGVFVMDNNRGSAADRVEHK